MRKLKINWINENPGALPGEGGYWISSEGRFAISPNYRSTVYPDSYSVRDLSTGREHRFFDTVKEAKEWCRQQCIESVKTHGNVTEIE